jgi:hypothetical protein
MAIKEGIEGAKERGKEMKPLLKIRSGQTQNHAHSVIRL